MPLRKFVAEAISEYLTSSKEPRQIAKDVGDEIIIAIKDYNP